MPIHTWSIDFFARHPWLTAFADLLVSGWLSAAEPLPAADLHGRMSRIDGLTILETWGSPSAGAAAQGTLLGEPAKQLLGLMSCQPQFMLQRRRRDFAKTLAAISDADRVAITALAKAAKLKPDDLLAANALVDVCCSAVVSPPLAERPQWIARNMDFFPAGPLGRHTVLHVTREDDRHAYAAVAWPGCLSVVSGINDAGLCGFLLLHHGGATHPGGEPIGLRLRAILQHETTVAGAAARFAATPVASGHYLLLADGRDARVIWQGADGINSDAPADGWLAATNGRRVDGQPADERGERLREVIAEAPPMPDAAWMRRIPSCSYMPGINAQAMILEPASLTLWLATGDATHPAALATWHRIDLRGWLAGTADPQPIAIEPAVRPLTHYTE